ncbi:hypothetical protein, partial [Pseudomonas putida]|uniref:hypothetical protein n=1 Tax=Pseudomonas putida TaxID=303 RepID=UPI001CF6A0DD
EGVGATAAALVDLSTVAGNKISNPPWVKFQSAGWVNFPSAPTAFALSAALFLFQGDDARNTMTKVQHDRCASFEAAGVEC